MALAGYGVFALDYPGFGLSEGLHGYIPNYSILVDDVAEHFAKVKDFVQCDLLPRQATSPDSFRDAENHIRDKKTSIRSMWLCLLDLLQLVLLYRSYMLYIVPFHWTDDINVLFHRELCSHLNL